MLQVILYRRTMNSFLVAAVIAIPFAVFLVLPARSQLTLTPMFADSDPEEALNETMTLSRVKRQYCPSNCYSTCSSNSQCQSLSSSLICIGGCCCTPNLSTACSGGPAIAACINGLCGQGYVCTSSGFCCQCLAGNSTGPCVNGLCPTGYACNTNNFCCALGSQGVVGLCVNGLCPTGFICGPGNLCYVNVTTG